MSRNKRVGTQFETDVVNFLKANGFPQCERRALGGRFDRGDIAGVPRWVLECKRAQKIELAEWMKEAEQEAANDNTNNFAVIIKRRMKSAGEAYAVMPLHVLARLIKGADTDGRS